MLDAAVVLAFDGVVDESTGTLDRNRTQLYVSNDYVMDLARRDRKILFSASVNPYRSDAITELERCVAGGAVHMKWLPIVQGFNPADHRCIPFYEALAHHKLPLLCHTGGERSLPRIDDSLADPNLLIPALDRGVTVIMAHCGTRSGIGEADHVETFRKLAHKYEHCYGDTAALNLPMRWHAYRQLRDDKVVQSKLVHGSDWPIPVLPPISQLGLKASLRSFEDSNWLRRDIFIKQQLGFDHDYWHRGAKILRQTEAVVALQRDASA